MYKQIEGDMVNVGCKLIFFNMTFLGEEESDMVIKGKNYMRMIKYRSSDEEIK